MTVSHGRDKRAAKWKSADVNSSGNCLNKTINCTTRKCRENARNMFTLAFYDQKKRETGKNHKNRLVNLVYLSHLTNSRRQ